VGADCNARRVLSIEPAETCADQDGGDKRRGSDLPGMAEGALDHGFRMSAGDAVVRTG
jgi:hypothetical protein